MVHPRPEVLVRLQALSLNHALVLCLCICSDTLSLGTRNFRFISHFACLPALWLPVCFPFVNVFEALNLLLYDCTVQPAAREPSSLCCKRWKCETCGWKDGDRWPAVCWKAESCSCFCWQPLESKWSYVHALFQAMFYTYIHHMHLCISFCTFRLCSSMLQGMFLWELRIWLPPFNQTVWSLNLQILKCKIEVRK